MMLVWTFAASLVDEVARLLRAMQKHRYLKEVDHRVHFAVDAALIDIPRFAAHSKSFEKRLQDAGDLEKLSRDPRLYRTADVEEIIEIFTAFWGPGAQSQARKERLVEVFREVGYPLPEHEPFESDPEQPPYPELIQLDWTLLAVDELDPERHQGALSAMVDCGEDISASEPVFQEGPAISIVELCDGAPLGILSEDLFLWSEGPVAYVDYVFRGVSKAAKLEEAPVGPYDEAEADPTAQQPATPPAFGSDYE